MYQITKWTRHITDDGKDQTLRSKPNGLDHKFRLKDDDGIIYGYGYSNVKDTFAPLDHYMPLYGCTSIEYFKDGKWEVL